MTGRQEGSKNTATRLLEEAAKSWAEYADQHPTASLVEIAKRFGVSSNAITTYLGAMGYDFNARRRLRGELARQEEQRRRDERAATRIAKMSQQPTLPRPEAMSIDQNFAQVNERLHMLLGQQNTMHDKLDRLLAELGVKTVEVAP